MLIFLLRHGLTDWNAAHRCQGTTDIPLNAEGIAQAQTLAARCASLSIERVYHSPLIRAAKTAEFVADACHAPLIPCDDLREVCLGVFQGLTREQSQAAYPAEATAYFSDPESVIPPNGESVPAVQRRAFAALEAAEKDAAGCRRIALVSHGVTIKTLICSIMDMPLDRFSRFDISNCSISVIESINGTHRLLTLNDLSHFGDPYAKADETRLLI